MVSKGKIANFLAVWDQRVSFAMRLDQKPLQFLAWGVQLTTLLAVLHVKIKYSAVAIGAAVVLIIIEGWILSKTNLQKKFDGVTSRQNQEWLDHVKDTKETLWILRGLKDKLNA